MARTGFEELDTGTVSSDTNDSWSFGTPRQTGSFVDDPRIPLSSGLLLELLSGVYYAMLVIFGFLYIMLKSHRESKKTSQYNLTHNFAKC